MVPNPEIVAFNCDINLFDFLPIHTISKHVSQSIDTKTIVIKNISELIIIKLRGHLKTGRLPRNREIKNARIISKISTNRMSEKQFKIVF